MVQKKTNKQSSWERDRFVVIDVNSEMPGKQFECSEHESDRWPPDGRPMAASDASPQTCERLGKPFNY